jgi:hypothetical protein
MCKQEREKAREGVHSILLKSRRSNYLTKVADVPTTTIDRINERVGERKGESWIEWERVGESGRGRGLSDQIDKDKRTSGKKMVKHERKISRAHRLGNWNYFSNHDDAIK